MTDNNEELPDEKDRIDMEIFGKDIFFLIGKNIVNDLFKGRMPVIIDADKTQPEGWYSFFRATDEKVPSVKIWSLHHHSLKTSQMYKRDFDINHYPLRLYDDNRFLIYIPDQGFLDDTFFKWAFSSKDKDCYLSDLKFEKDNPGKKHSIIIKFYQMLDFKIHEMEEQNDE